MRIHFLKFAGGQGCSTFAAFTAIDFANEGKQVRIFGSDQRAILACGPDGIVNPKLRVVPDDWADPIFGGVRIWDGVDPGCDVDTRVLVTKACYLHLRKVRELKVQVDAVMVLREDGRSLTDRDIERVVGAPVVATIAYQMHIARAVDAGLVASIPTADDRKLIAPMYARCRDLED
jgi:hypothetical protein